MPLLPFKIFKRLSAVAAGRPLLATGLMLAAAPLYAQSIGPSAIDAAGGGITASSGITYEYAIGQMGVDNTPASGALIVTPGVLQPNTGTTGMAGLPIAPAQVKVFPDPVQSTLLIQPAFSGKGSLKLGLYDAAGKLVRRQEADLRTGEERQSMDLSALAAGNYLLQITWLSGGQTFASGYKLQKLQ